MKFYLFALKKPVWKPDFFKIKCFRFIINQIYLFFPGQWIAMLWYFHTWLWMPAKEFSYLPVVFENSSSSFAADGPSAMVWIIAPLSFTLSVQVDIDESSPSVSNTISEPYVVPIASVIICIKEKECEIQTDYLLNTGLFQRAVNVYI